MFYENLKNGDSVTEKVIFGCRKSQIIISAS